MADTTRLIRLGMPVPLAKEVAEQIEGAAVTPVAYSEEPADLAAALVNAGLMEPDA